MRTVKLNVAGQGFNIKSDASEEHLASLAKEVDERFQTLKKKGRARGDQDLMIMAMVAVSLLDELKTALEKYHSVHDASTTFANQLVERIDALLIQDVI